MGLVLFPFIVGISFFIFSIITGIANFLAYGLAKGMRALFGIKGSWVTGATISIAVASMAKYFSMTLLVLGILIFLVVPVTEPVSGWMTAGAGILAFSVWMPAVFLGALFATNNDYAAISSAFE